MTTDVWIDLTNSPHIHYFSRLIEKLEKEGLEYIITARRFQSLEDLINIYGYEYTSFGEHSSSLSGKLVNSANRIIELTKFISKKENMPKVAVAKHSVELPRVSFGLDIPSIFVLDNETAVAQNKLTLPLIDELICPIGTKNKLDELQKSQNISYFNMDNVLSFDGTCEVANVNARSKSDKYPIDNTILYNLDIDTDLPIVVLRSCPNSSYCTGKSDLLPKIIEELFDKIGCNIVVFPRTSKQREIYSKYDNIIVPKTIDALSLLHFSNMMIGAGGTMNREAAVMGVPTVSCYPETLLGVDEYLAEKGTMIHTTDLKEILEYAITNIGVKNKIVDLEDPTELMFQKICEKMGR
ncbi:DUF354 domain-containing protein [Methanococcus voltae]|uniref:DUF354 domain-containing protein n=1 Tax=Methanococcus voltae (strain ATCC BAA-1334 / A3) TaxID=456320 RepID=D7DTD0_METV3|nr:DUF354 domain-containing protein [Methanococcus voltae]MCS3901241.1 putative glycosyltransferase [Methanococcus voltae]